jgi:quinolinate synthase
MKKISMSLVIKSLEGSAGKVVKVEKDIADKAYGSLRKMLDMSA